MERISVAIRVRPPGKQELNRRNKWVVEEKTITLCNSYGVATPGYSYAFDQVFGSASRNLDVYKNHAKEVISSAVEGFNGTVFAYGQTSSGKTFTMQGSAVDPGIIHRAVRDVFSNIERISEREFLIRVSYMEIYNEEINDLLAPDSRKLHIHENLERGVFVAGLREEIVNSPEQVFEFLRFGEAHRHFGETNMNLYSSRSHTIFRMIIESRDKSKNTDAVRVSALNMVDLAGSERVAKTGAGGVRLKEGTHINKSLMTLGTVINKLSEGPGKGGHIPYRDSKLTRILQSALDGNAKTAIICTVTPDEIHLDETKGTLQFASRAKKIATCAHVNEILTDAALLKRQKREIEELRQKLQGMRSDDFENQLLKLRNDLLKYELEKEKLALELEEEKKAHEQRNKEQQQKIENLSSLVLCSSKDDLKFSKKSSRRETWCPQQIGLEPVGEDFGSPFKESDPVDRSLVSSRRKRDGSMTPLPAFDALIGADADTLWSCSSKLDEFSDLPELPIPMDYEEVADEDAWTNMNKHPEDTWTNMNKQPIADEDTWSNMNKNPIADEDTWTNLNKPLATNDATVDSRLRRRSDSRGTQSSRVDLDDFRLKELEVQYEELQTNFKYMEHETKETKKHLERVLTENNDLQSSLAQQIDLCDALRKDKDEESNQAQLQLKALRGENSRLGEIVANLHKDLDLHVQQCAELQEKCTKKEREAVDVNQQSEILMCKLTTIETQLELQKQSEVQLRQQHEELQANFRIKEHEELETIQQLQAENSLTQSQFENQRQIFSQLQLQYDELLASCQMKEGNFKRNLEMLRVENTNLQTNLEMQKLAEAQMGEQYKDLEARSIEKDKKAFETKQELDALLMENEKLQLRIQSMQMEFVAKEQELVEAKEQMEITKMNYFENTEQEFQRHLQQQSDELKRSYESELKKLCSENRYLEDEQMEVEKRMEDVEMEQSAVKHTAQNLVEYLANYSQETNSMLASSLKEIRETAFQLQNMVNRQSRSPKAKGRGVYYQENQLQKQQLHSATKSVATPLSEKTNRLYWNHPSSQRSHHQNHHREGLKAIHTDEDDVRVKTEYSPPLKADDEPSVVENRRGVVIPQQLMFSKGDEEMVMMMEERVRMSQEHIAMLEREVAVMRVERDRVYRVLAAQVSVNEEAMLSMKYEKLQLAQELSKCMGVLASQHDNVASICLGLKEFEDDLIKGVESLKMGG